MHSRKTYTAWLDQFAFKPVIKVILLSMDENFREDHEGIRWRNLRDFLREEQA